MRRLALLLTSVMLTAVPGQPVAPPAQVVPAPAVSRPATGREPVPLRPMTTVEAVQGALMDATGSGEADEYTRYIWCPQKKFQAVNLACNIAMGRNQLQVKQAPLFEGVLLRVNLRLFCNDDKDLEDLTRIWEELRYDPTFNLLVTEQNAKFAGQKLDKDEFIRPLVPDYLPELIALQEGLHTKAPIVLDKYFCARALSTIKVDPATKQRNAFTVLLGGLYYEFRGIKRSKDPEYTDEDDFLRLFGVSKKLFERIKTDQRAALFVSGVTGRQRRVDFFNTPSGRGWDFVGLGSVTHDIRQEDIDVDTHSVMNLLVFKDFAREEIFVGPNGLHVYAIFDGAGKLLDEAAINVVVDRTVPNPHPPRLQCAISCISCHEADGSDGWKSVRNDAKTLLNSKIMDVTSKDFAEIQRIAGLYTGDFSNGFRIGRMDYSRAVMLCTGPMGDGADQDKIVQTATSEITAAVHNWLYKPVTSADALEELGLIPDKDKPAEQFAKLLPPEPSEIGFLPEDPRVGALKLGIAVPRTDWAFTFSYTMSRIVREQKKQQKK
jgi:hypothetical protein